MSYFGHSTTCWKTVLYNGEGKSKLCCFLLLELLLLLVLLLLLQRLLLILLLPNEGGGDCARGHREGGGEVTAAIFCLYRHFRWHFHPLQESRRLYRHILIDTQQLTNLRLSVSQFSDLSQFKDLSERSGLSQKVSKFKLFTILVNLLVRKPRTRKIL